jgi:hypothetical protein
MDKVKEMTRQELIDLLIEDDYETVQVDAEYFYNIMLTGFGGYAKYTDKELLTEYDERTENNRPIRIIKEKV